MCYSLWSRYIIGEPTNYPRVNFAQHESRFVKGIIMKHTLVTYLIRTYTIVNVPWYIHNGICLVALSSTMYLYYFSTTLVVYLIRTYTIVSVPWYISQIVADHRKVFLKEFLSFVKNRYKLNKYTAIYFIKKYQLFRCFMVSCECTMVHSQNTMIIFSSSNTSPSLQISGLCLLWSTLYATMICKMLQYWQHKMQGLFSIFCTMLVIMMRKIFNILEKFWKPPNF